MEEDIPTALYLLRALPKQSFETMYPGMKYYKFVMSALFRIGLGYLFLVNVFLVIIRAQEVLTIFYGEQLYDDDAQKLYIVQYMCVLTFIHGKYVSLLCKNTKTR